MDTQNSDAPSQQRFELAPVEDLDAYMLYGNTEIQHLLRAIAQHGELVTLYFGGSNDFLLTSVLAVSAGSVLLDCGIREEDNRRVLASTKLVFVTARDRIKVQWTSSRVWRVMHDGKPAFCIATPDSLLRLQRRECYRLPAPIAKPLRCTVPVQGEAGARKLEFSVADISLGGMALHGPIQQAAFAIGKRYPDCEIPLPGMGTLVATIVIANIFEVTLRNGSRALRSGCSFVDVQGKMLMLLQRYINQIERERHERMARLA